MREARKAAAERERACEALVDAANLRRNPLKELSVQRAFRSNGLDAALEWQRGDIKVLCFRGSYSGGDFSNIPNGRLMELDENGEFCVKANISGNDFIRGVFEAGWKRLCPRRDAFTA